MTDPAWKRNGRSGPLDWWLGCQTHGDQWDERCLSCGIAIDHNIDFEAKLERERAADAGVRVGAPSVPPSEKT